MVEHGSRPVVCHSTGAYNACVYYYGASLPGQDADPGQSISRINFCTICPVETLVQPKKGCRSVHLSCKPEKYLHLPSSSFIKETGKAVPKDASEVTINTATKALSIAEEI